MSDENIESFECPKCRKPQKYFVKRGGNWVRCPGCDKGILKKNVPSVLVREDPEFISKRDTGKKASHQSSKHEEYEVSPDSPFAVDKEPWQLLDEVLKQFKVKDIGRMTAVTRCKRQALHPRELASTLSGLDLGIKKSVITFIVDEYYYALEGEKNRRSDSGDTRHYFSFDERDDERYVGGSGSSREREGREHSVAWDRKSTRSNAPLTAADVDRMFEERITKRDKELAKEKELDELKGMVGEMAGVIKDLKRDADSPRRGDDDRFFEMMKMQHEERIEQLQSAATDRESFLRELQKERDGHNKMMIDYYKTSATRSNVDGYKDDSVRLLASTVDKVGGIIEKKEPMKFLAASQRQPQPLEENPVTRKDKKDVGILSLLYLSFFISALTAIEIFSSRTSSDVIITKASTI